MIILSLLLFELLQVLFDENNSYHVTISIALMVCSRYVFRHSPCYTAAILSWRRTGGLPTPAGCVLERLQEGKWGFVWVGEKCGRVRGVCDIGGMRAICRGRIGRIWGRCRYDIVWLGWVGSVILRFVPSCLCWSWSKNKSMDSHLAFLDISGKSIALLASRK